MADGVHRTAVRTGLLALTPILLWLWLLAASAILRRYGLDTQILRPAMLLVGALALIRMGVFVLRHSLSPGSQLKAYEGTFTLTIWALAAIHILGLMPFVQQTLDEYSFTVGQVTISIYTILSFAFSVVLLLLIALWLANVVQWRLRRSQVLDESLKIALSKISKFALLTIAVIAAMLAAGIDLTAFAVFGGALGVGIGLGLQRIVSNFVSGIILAFEGSIRPGDVISIGNTFGTVQALHARHIVVRTRDGLDILVPNENLLTQDITNWSYGDRNVRIKLPVQISYDDDPEMAIAVLIEAALTHQRVLKDPPPTGVLVAFGESGIDMEARFWVKDPEHGVGNVRSEVNRAIWQALKRAGISIPYPQRDLHIKGPVPAGVPRADK
ncbi:MAG: mechanosensitive ion channel [Pseudomonadota bacterium]|nr:MAG: mechanosensitive ion channel [Pseudomonadota bacterium]